MAINKAFLGHGIFCEESVTHALTRFQNYSSRTPGTPPPKNNIDRFIYALKDMNISTVWIQLFSRAGEYDTDAAGAALRKDLITALGQAGISWAGWGYCGSQTWQRDANTLIPDIRNRLNMTAFVIDAEPGNKCYTNPAFPNDPNQNLPDSWAQSDFDQLTKMVNTLFGTGNLALSTWPVLKLQDSAENPVITLMRIAAPRVCLFAPQAYWMNWPGAPHYNAGFSQATYPPNDPVSFVRLVIDSWRKLNFTNPLVVTGQAYWSDGEDTPPQATMELKVDQFVKNFADWPKIVGFNWYHAVLANTAEEGSMSDAMITAIAGQHLGGKPYQPG